ncbi:hypothetical protein IG605_010020 [Pectobacterium quasiaquaticum]|nr:hypothetical protein IG605_010020 [Pectobacterium quasiaquaticum]
MRNLKNILDVCDIYISGEFVEFRDFYPASGLHVLVIKKINYDCAEKYFIFIPAADWDYVHGLGFKSGDGILVPVVVDFDFDASHPLMWLSDRHEITKK